MTVIAATDGSSLGNPGPAGWAWFVDEHNWATGALAESTNNVGELLAVLDLLRQTSESGEDLHIIADSQYVINALTKWRFAWKKKGWTKGDGKPVANRDLMEALDAQLETARKLGRSIQFEWVRGHNDHSLNEKADALARGAASAIRDSQPIDQGPGFQGAELVKEVATTEEPNALFSFEVDTEANGLASVATKAGTQFSLETTSGDVMEHTTHTYIQHGVHVSEHKLYVPLDYSDPSGPQIQLFARELTLDKNGPNLNQPAIIFMQGGPGGRAPRPGDFNSGWIRHALKTHRVILMDERGTGLSTRLDSLTLSALDSVQDQVAYIKHFRADNMVRDAETLRELLNGGKKWASLGQSYGGFINTAYLSLAPNGLDAVYFTGGLPGLVEVDDIYRRTYRATAARNEVYFKRYPTDQETLKDVLKHLDNHDERLPTGERLTGRRLRMLGLLLGTTTGFDQLHYFFEEPFISVRGQKRLNTQFLSMVSGQVSFADSPMYGLLHETIYAGVVPELSGSATNWAAERLLEEVGSSIPEGFAPEPDYNSNTAVYLTGEHIYPLIFDEAPALTPLRELAWELARHKDWDPIYDLQSLANNEVPSAAAVYFEDMFVPADLSMQTAELAHVRTWVTNEFQHDGLRVDGARVLEHLTKLAFD